VCRTVYRSFGATKCLVIVVVDVLLGENDWCLLRLVLRGVCFFLAHDFIVVKMESVSDERIIFYQTRFVRHVWWRFSCCPIA